MRRHLAWTALVATTLALVSVPAFTSSAHADAAPFEVMPADPLPGFTEGQGNPPPQTSIVNVTGSDNFSKALQVDVTASPTSPGLDGEYSIALGAKTGAPMQANDAVVATLWARRVQPTTGTGEATFLLERDGGSFKKSAEAALQIGTEWKQFSFPFRVAETYAAGEAHFQFWLGYGPQTLQFAGISLLDYGQGDPAAWPKVTYEGRAADAPWRTAAADRIDRYRKGDLAVRVVDPQGVPVDGATVKVDEQKSAFHFGAAEDAAYLLGDSSANETLTDQQHIRSNASTLFDSAALGNNLKWTHWENQTERDNLTYPALEWYQNHNVYLRGHNLVWGSFGLMPADVAKLAGDPAALRARINAHVTDEASQTRGLVNEWDVVNEAYSEHAVTDILGPTELDNWYRLAHQAAPDATLYLNDYGLVEDNGWDQRHLAFEYNTAKDMLARGAPLQGIGLESHFGSHGGLELTPPEDLLPIVDKFASLGLKVGVTEFDVATTDQQLQADYTRDFMTQMFSDPNVNEISDFGYWAKTVYNPLVALYNTDWSPKPNALVVEDLLRHQWWTNAQGTTAASGKYTTRAFQGDYTVSVTVGGVTKQVKVSMPTTAGAQVTVVADGIGTSVQPQTPDLVGGGAFETGTQGWAPLGQATSDVHTTVSADAHSGSQALSLAQGTGVAQTARTLSAGTSYTLSGWAKLTGPGTQCYIGVRGGTGANTTTPKFQYELSYADEREYAQKLLAFTPPAGTTWTQLFVWSNPNPTSATCLADDLTLTPTQGVPPPALAPPFITPKLPAVSALLNGTFENQANTTGWYCLGTCTLKNALTTPHSGAGDLSVSARSAAFAGPAQGVAVSNGQQYDSSAWVRLASPGSDTAMVSLKVTTSTGATTFRFGSAAVSDTGWTRIGSNDVKVTWTGTLQKAEWWVSTVNGTEDVLVDDASFAPRAPAPPGTDLLGNGDAEQGNDGSWYCFAPCVAQAATDQVHGGSTSIRTTNRQFNFTGPAQGVQVTNGVSYKTSAWVRMADGAPDATAQIRLKLTMSDGSSVTLPMAAATVTAGAWTQVTANDVKVSWTGTLSKAEWWVSTTAGADDFYVDDAALQPAGVAAPAFDPVQPTDACVVRNHFRNTYTAYFGYSNPNAFSVPVATGGSNAFSPGPADRGQPQSFLPDGQSQRVAVTWNGTPLTWQLNGVSTTASASSPSC